MGSKASVLTKYRSHQQFLLTGDLGSRLRFQWRLVKILQNWQLPKIAGHDTVDVWARLLLRPCLEKSNNTLLLPVNCREMTPVGYISGFEMKTVLSGLSGES